MVFWQLLARVAFGIAVVSSIAVLVTLWRLAMPPAQTALPIAPIDEQSLALSRAIERLENGDSDGLGRSPGPNCYLTLNTGFRSRPEPYFAAGAGIGLYRRDGSVRTCTLTDGRIGLELPRGLRFRCGTGTVSIDRYGPPSDYQTKHKITPAEMIARHPGYPVASKAGIWRCYGWSDPPAADASAERASGAPKSAPSPTRTLGAIED